MQRLAHILKETRKTNLRRRETLDAVSQKVGTMASAFYESGRSAGDGASVGPASYQIPKTIG